MYDQKYGGDQVSQFSSFKTFYTILLQILNLMDVSEIKIQHAIFNNLYYTFRLAEAEV